MPENFRREKCYYLVNIYYGFVAFVIVSAILMVYIVAKVLSQVIG